MENLCKPVYASHLLNSQGLVLGPLLFIYIYIDGVTSTPLSDSSKMTLNAAVILAIHWQTY